MKKTMKRSLSFLLLAGALVSCGGKTSNSVSSNNAPADSSSENKTSTSSSSEAVEEATFVASYDISQYHKIDAVGWYVVDDYQLLTYSNSTYRLVYTEDMFGQIDDGFETKGHRVLVTEGTYTTVESSDGIDGHIDISLSASPIVFGYQHDKGYSRSTDILGTTTFIDTSNWTSAMTDATSAAYPNGASDVLTKYGSAKTVTAEDPSTFTEDSTLAYKLVTVPADDADGKAAPALSKFKTMKAGYDLSSYSQVASLGWYDYSNDFVLTFTDGTYFRNVHKEYFGVVDSGYETKGSRNVITEGTYTLSDTSTDGIDGHGDLSLSASKRVYLYQHHKAWTYHVDVIGTPLVVDTDNWTDAMTTAVKATYTDKAGFVAQYGSAKKAIVSDPTLFPDDTTLAYKMISID